MFKKVNLRKETAQGRKAWFRPVLSVIIALAVGGILIAMNGYNPFMVYGMLIKSLWSFKGFLNILLRMTPLLICGLAINFTYRAGMVNIGAGGQLYIGAMCATVVGLYVRGLPLLLHVPLCFLAAMIGGALWSMPIATLKIKYGTPEIITALMMNYIGDLLVNFIIAFPLHNPESIAPQSDVLISSALLPRLSDISQANVGIFVAVILACILQFIAKHTKLGFEMSITGDNTNAALAGGIPIKKRLVQVMAISGALAGLAGAVEVMGVHSRLIMGFSGNYGFESIAVSFLGGTPLMIIISALFFGALKVGINAINYSTNLSGNFITVLEGLVIMFLAAPLMIKKMETGFSKLFNKLFKRLILKVKGDVR